MYFLRRQIQHDDSWSTCIKRESVATFRAGEGMRAAAGRATLHQKKPEDAHFSIDTYPRGAVLVLYLKSLAGCTVSFSRCCLADCEGQG